jgi:hypothetical protein
MRSAEHRKEKGAIVENNAILEYNVSDHGDYLGTAAGFIEEHLMFDDDDTHSRGRSSSDVCPTADPDTVSDELLEKVQQTYDVFARLRSNVSHCGQELMRVVGLTPDGVETVRRGLALSKNMLEATFESVVINCVLIFVHCLRINLCRILTQACSTFEEILITQQNMLRRRQL